MDSSLFMLTDDGSTLLTVRQTDDGSLELLSTPVTILPSTEQTWPLLSSPTTDISPNIDSNNVTFDYTEAACSSSILNQEPQDISMQTENQNTSMDFSEPSETECNSVCAQIENEKTSETVVSSIAQKNLSTKSPLNCQIKEVSVSLERISVPPKKYARKKLGRPKNNSKAVKELPCFKCDLCGQEFKKQYLLQKHMHDHAQDKPHQCPKCPATFNVPTNFTLHMATHNIGEPKCPECGRRFARIASLKAHLVMHEMDETLYCTECDDSFATQSQLEAHMSLHNEKWSTDEHRRCKLCRKQFTKPVLYRQHLRDHYKLQLKSAKQTRRGIRHRTAYKCKVCLKVFQKPSQLARHIRVHTGEKPYKCNICSRSFTQKSSVRVHMWYHNKIRPYSCSLCHAKFSQKSNLSSHELRVHREPEGDGEARLSYRCIHCPCTFKRLASLTNHLRRSHATDSQTSPDSQLTGANEATAEQGEEAPRANGQRLEHRLADLGESHNPEPAEGRDELELEPHRPGDGFVLMDEKENTAVVTLIDKDAQNAKGKYVKLKQRLVNDSRLYECSFCHKTFKKPSDLLRHLRVHTKEKPFKCEICGQSFALKLTLQTHEKIHARVIEKIPCPMCKAMLNSEKGLFDHIGKYHRCTLCEKRYASLEEQTSHALVHLNSAPTEERSKAKAKLPTEVQSLARQVVLQEPLVITETGNGLVRAQPRYCNELARGKGRPHKCPGCPAAFMKLSHLKQHYRKHTGERPFSCPLCDRKFVTNSALKAHRRIHECSRPYRCSVCGQRFTTLSGMKRHHLKHTNKRPFMCPYCNKTFKSTVNCKKHMQIHKTEIAQQQLELQKKQQQPPQAGLNKPVIISDQKITFQPITANLSLNLNDQIQNLMCNQKISDSCVPGSSMIQNNQPLPQTIPVVSNPNIGSAQTLHADETGTVTLSNYSGSQTLTSESIKELEETLNQQLLSLGVNFALSNNAQQMIEQKNTSGETQEQPILSIIYDNGATLQSPVTLNTLAGGDNLHILASQLNAFDINQIALQNNEIHMEVTPTNSETVLQNQAHSLPLISNDFQFHTSIEPKEANIISHQSNDLLINSDNVSVKENNVVVAKEANLQCHICDVQKLSENELKEHLKTHQEKQKYQCTHCSSKFCSLRSLSRHIKIHEVQEKHKCYECNQEFPTSLQLREHIKDHVKKELKQKNPENAEDVIKELESENKNKGNKKNSTSNTCQYCSKIFRKPSDLIRHVRTHTGERPYQCNFCQKSFAVKCTLDSHLKIHSNEKSFHCNVCNNMFSTKGSLKVHMRLHTGSKPFNCPMCEMTFRTSGHRKVHLLSHAKESKCQKLKRKLTSIGLLADEVENLAENTSAAEVSEMQAEFKQMYPECFEAESEVVEQKQNAVNDNDQNFEQLEIPGEMSFSSDVADGELMNLSEHSQIVANLQFLLANGLVTIQTEDPASNQVSLATTSIVPSDFELSHNQKPVEETIAPQIFFNADSLPDSTVPNARTEEANLALNNYMVLQLDSVDSTVQIRNGELEEAAAQSPSGGTRRECEECGKTFAKPCQLERHKRVHTGERPFKCDQCDKSFSQKSSLTMHQYSHTGDRPYPCSQCERSFTQSYNLQTHMRRVHKVEPAEAKRLAKAQQFFHYDPKMPSPTLITDTPLTLHDLAFNDMLK